MNDTEFYIDEEHDLKLEKPEGAVQAHGFEAQGSEFAEMSLDLNKLVIKDPTSTYFMKLDSNNWEDTHILQGDLLVIDSGYKTLSNGDLVVCVIEGKLEMRRVVYQNKELALLSHNDVVQIDNDDPFQIFGKITYTFRQART